MIYGLVDPRTRLVRYVGCSSRGFERPRAHAMPSARKFNPYKDRWIKQLEAAGLSYEIAVLAPSTPETLKADEIWWIAYARASGWPITNLTDGGDGTLGWVPPPEYRAKISARFKGRKFTPEHLAKIAAKHRGRKATDEARENMRRAHTGKTQPPETIAKRNATRAATLAATEAARFRPALRVNLIGNLDVTPRRKPNPPITAETRAKMADAKRGRKQAPETIARRAAALTGKMRTPEQRAKLSAAQQARHAHRTHCPHGHALTPDNIRPNRPGRECKTCWHESARRSNEKKRALKTGGV